MNTYHFRKYVTYQESYEVEAETEEGARNKLADMKKEDARDITLISQDGEAELSKTIEGDVEEVEDTSDQWQQDQEDKEAYQASQYESHREAGHCDNE